MLALPPCQCNPVLAQVVRRLPRRWDESCDTTNTTAGGGAHENGSVRGGTSAAEGLGISIPRRWLFLEVHAPFAF